MRKKTIIFDVTILFIFFFLISPSYAQCTYQLTASTQNIDHDFSKNMQIPPVEIWNKSFGGLAPDGLNSIQKTSYDNGFILCGYTYSYSNGKEDMWIVKTDELGEELCNSSFGGVSHDKGLDIIETTNQEYLAIGQIYSSDTFSYDCMLIKLDENGQKEWEKTFGGTGSDSGTNIQSTLDNGFVFIMNSEKQDSTLCYLIKINHTGSIEWQILLNDQLSSDMINGLSLCKTADQGFLLIGQMQTEKNGLDAFLIKTNKDGIIQWNKTYGGKYTDFFRSIHSSHHGLILCGTTRSFGKGSYDVWLLFTDESGNEQWNTTFGASLFEEGFNAIPFQDYGYIITGYTSSFSVGQTDLWLIQTDEKGKMVWNETFGGLSSDKGCSLEDLGNDEYVIVGNMNGDGWLQKFHFFKNDSLQTSVVIGSIHQIHPHAENLSIIQTKQLKILQLNPISYQSYDTVQSVIIYDEYMGLLTSQYIIGLFQATVI